LRRALADRDVPCQIVDPRRHGRPRFLVELARARAEGALVHVHTNGHNPKSWWLAAAGTFAQRSLLTVHSGLAPEFIRAHQRMIGVVCRRFEAVIAVSPAIGTALGAAGADVRRLMVLPAFSASSTAFHLPPAGLRAIRRQHGPLIACALAPGREYGVDLMLESFARVRAQAPTAALLLYGPGTRSEELVAEVTRRGLKGAVFHYGELERARALGLLALSDLFVRPTRADGDSLSVREALALGRKVIASSASVRPAATHTFPAENAEALSEAIFHALSNPAPTDERPEDCLPALLDLYRRLGVRLCT
jgi:glycosyltransferase involved in cell wall biosynthesis